MILVMQGLILKSQAGIESIGPWIIQRVDSNKLTSRDIKFCKRMGDITDNY